MNDDRIFRFKLHIKADIKVANLKIVISHVSLLQPNLRCNIFLSQNVTFRKI